MKTIHDLTDILQQYRQIHFVQPAHLWVCLAVVVLIPLWKKLGSAVANTFVSGHRIRSHEWPAFICAALLATSWIPFCLALARPQLCIPAIKTFIRRESSRF
jgi:hypothetical protein